MAKGQAFTGRQKKIVERYYEHRDTIMLTKLGDAVTNLYLAETPAKADKLWKSVETALKNVDPEPAVAAKIVAEKDIEGLAKRLNQLQSSAGGERR